MTIENNLVIQTEDIGASEDYERYIKMALRIAPNDPVLLFK